jgi:hypothetical protein
MREGAEQSNTFGATIRSEATATQSQEEEREKARAKDKQRAEEK